MSSLAGKVAVVAGASRGAGRGIARVLGDAGATVYAAARTSRAGPKPPDGAAGTVEDTAEEVTTRGGRGIPVCVDLSHAGQAAALFRRVEEEQGRLDVLANSAWGANFMPEWNTPFWDLSATLWGDTLEAMGAGWLASVYQEAVPLGSERVTRVHRTRGSRPGGRCQSVPEDRRASVGGGSGPRVRFHGCRRALCAAVRPGGAATSGRVAPGWRGRWSSTLLDALQHGGPQHPVEPGLITLPWPAQPGRHAGIQAAPALPACAGGRELLGCQPGSCARVCS
jgi:NAD(P)-dependent dehydrogenase (short-subunit alcohol dehydrogenase family)